MMNIHRRIRERREKLQLSMQTVGERVGVVWQTVQQWEKEEGGTAPKRERLKRVADALETTPEYLLWGHPHPADRNAIIFPEAPRLAAGESINLAVSSGVESAQIYQAEMKLPGSSAFLYPIPDDQMAPRYMRGDFALVEPAIEAEVEDDVLVQLVSGEVKLARLISRRDVVRLGSWNDTRTSTHAEDTIVWIYFVSGFVPAKKVRRTSAAQ